MGTETEILEQVEKAEKLRLESDKINNRILSHKHIGYVYGVIVNQLCHDLKIVAKPSQPNADKEVRAAILKKVMDLKVNLVHDMNKYIRDDKNRYEASLSMRGHVGRLATKLYNDFNKSNSMFADLKVRCTLNTFRFILELKGYLETQK